MNTSPPSVTECLRRILEIVPGERPLLPDFGCRVHMLGTLVTRSDFQLAAALIEEALETWAPQWQFDGVGAAPSRPGWILVTVRSGGVRHQFEIRHRTASGSPVEGEGMDGMDEESRPVKGAFGAPRDPGTTWEERQS
jgi:phage baseplate assembly protein W